MSDMKRLGRADDVTMMVFSEFGRRVGENANLGTDHGTAGPVFVIGAPVRGGMYGEMPSLTDLDDGNYAVYDGLPPRIRDPDHTVDGTGRRRRCTTAAVCPVRHVER